MNKSKVIHMPYSFHTPGDGWHSHIHNVLDYAHLFVSLCEKPGTFEQFKKNVFDNIIETMADSDRFKEFPNVDIGPYLDRLYNSPIEGNWNTVIFKLDNSKQLGYSEKSTSVDSSNPSPLYLMYTSIKLMQELYPYLLEDETADEAYSKIEYTGCSYTGTLRFSCDLLNARG